MTKPAPPKKGTKGTFTKLALSLGKKYIIPPSRRGMILFGLLFSVVVLGYFFLDHQFRKSRFISSGALSSNHAGFTQDCMRCHTPLEAVTNRKCSFCHEKSGSEMGVYSFAAHYRYQSKDSTRIKAAREGHGLSEWDCSQCHPEHRGRDAPITGVPDAKCLKCHPYGSFNQGHPEFQFVREQWPDDDGLIFTHVRHAKFVDEYLRERGGAPYLENACLHCHEAQPDGKTFQPIDYDRHCGTCHLNRAETPLLPVATRENPYGVLTLGEIRRQNRPGTQWVNEVSPQQFVIKQRNGEKISKKPVVHRDPWIMENLQWLREAIHPGTGLAGLLKTTRGKTTDDPARLYRQAVAALETQVAQLKGRPEKAVQQDLVFIESELKRVKEMLERAESEIAVEPFSMDPALTNAKLSEGQIEDLQELAMSLTSQQKKLCRECHLVEMASILRVQKHQGIMVRARFDHRAHILDRRCLDCHNQIPISESMREGGEVTHAQDNSAIQNLPGIGNCKECHNPEGASNRCVTCHAFHPDKDSLANLRLFVE